MASLKARLTAAWLLLLPFSTAVSALYATSGSPCDATCQWPQNGTYYPDLVCSDHDFWNTEKGQLLKDCMKCEGASTYINGTNSDEYWYLYHMKYVQEYCLIDNTTPHIPPVLECATECAPLGTTLDTLWISHTPFLPQYAYCSSDAASYPNYGPACAACLRSKTGSVILGNFVDTMVSACSSKPFASATALVSADRPLFATSTVASIATPSGAAPTSGSTTGVTTTSATPTTGSPSTTAPSSIFSSGALTGSPSPTTVSTAASSGGLSSGAAAGIAVGAAIAVALIAAAAFFWWRKRRSGKQMYELDSSGHAELPVGASYYDFESKPKSPLSGTSSERQGTLSGTSSELQGHELYETQGNSVYMPVSHHDPAELPG